MSGNDESTDGEQAWRPERMTDYADGPVLTQRQAETIATLDTTNSRESTAALRGITASTVDDHRQNGQARAVAAIRQLRYLLGESETIRQVVEDEFGSDDILTGSAGYTTDSAFPHLSTEELVEKATSEPEPPQSNQITLGGPARKSRNRRLWKAAFYDEFGDAEQVEMVDATTGERVDVGSLIERFPAQLDTETIPVTEFQDADILGRFLSDLRWTVSSMEESFEFRRIE